MTALDKRARDLARDEATCRRLMTVPGVGVLSALTFMSAVDVPSRFRSSKRVGAHFGLTPKKHQSGGDAGAWPPMRPRKPAEGHHRRDHQGR
jgi:transposase